MITLVRKYPPKHTYYGWWAVYGHAVVKDLKSIGIKYDDIKPLVIPSDDSWRVKVSDEESITMLKLMT